MGGARPACRCRLISSSFRARVARTRLSFHQFPAPGAGPRAGFTSRACQAIIYLTYILFIVDFPAAFPSKLTRAVNIDAPLPDELADAPEPESAELIEPAVNDAGFNPAAFISSTALLLTKELLTI